MTKREELIQASLDQDYAAIRRLGWWEIWVGLKDWWEGTRFEPRDLIAYADALGDEDPAAILASLRSLLERDWRPKPSRIYREMKQRQARISAAEAALRAQSTYTRPDQSAASFRRVLELRDAGTPVCDCNPRPTGMTLEELNGYRWTPGDWASHRERGRKSSRLPDHVIRCVRCDGLEQGQVWQAEDATPDDTLGVS